MTTNSKTEIIQDNGDYIHVTRDPSYTVEKLKQSTCVNCAHPLTTHQIAYSDGCCPYCGHLSSTTLLEDVILPVDAQHAIAPILPSPPQEKWTKQYSCASCKTTLTPAQCPKNNGCCPYCGHSGNGSLPDCTSIARQGPPLEEVKALNLRNLWAVHFTCTLCEASGSSADKFCPKCGGRSMTAYTSLPYSIPNPHYQGSSVATKPFLSRFLAYIKSLFSMG